MRREATQAWVAQNKLRKRKLARLARCNKGVAPAYACAICSRGVRGLPYKRLFWLTPRGILVQGFNSRSGRGVCLVLEGVGSVCALSLE